MVKWPKVKTNNIPHILYPGEFGGDQEVSNNLPTDTESIYLLKGHYQCDRRQKMNSSGCVAPSIVYGGDILLDIIEKGWVCF